MAVQTAFAGNITDINVSTLPDSQKIIKIRFDRDVTSPSGFVTSAPARIALDFANTTIRLPQSVLGVCRSVIKIRLRRHKNNDRSRIVLGLNKTAQYNTEIHGNEVWVFVSESADRNSAMSVSIISLLCRILFRQKKQSKSLIPLISTSVKARAIQVLLN